MGSVISKRQGDRSKHSFLERKKNTPQKEKFIYYEHPEYHITWWIVLWSNPFIDFTKYCSYLKIFSMECRKSITVEDNKKRMNITNFTNIYTNIYTNNISDKIDSKQKWFNKLVLLTIIILYYFLLQDFHIWSVSQILEMEGSYHLLSYKN